MPGSDHKYLPYFALVAGILALSLSSLFVRWAAAPGTVTSFFRMTIASVVLLPFFLGRKGLKLKVNWRWVPLALLGGLFTALDHSIWSTAINQTRIANATLMNNIAPLWVALIAALVWKERLNGKFWIGLLLTLTGAGIVFGHDLIANPHLSGGDLLAIISSIFYAGYFLTTQRGRTKLDTLTYIFFVDISASVLLLGANLVLRNPFSGYSTNTYLAFLGAALISQVIGYFSVGYALGHLSAAVVAPTMILQPVLTALLAIPLAHEALLPAQWIGGLIVLGGIYLVNLVQSQKVKESEVLPSG